MKAKSRLAKKGGSFADRAGRALRLAAKDARKVAKMYGTPIYIVENGKLVAKQP